MATHFDSRPFVPGLTRRSFLLQTAAAASAAAFGTGAALAKAAHEETGCPVAVFSKVYQELKLSFEDAAAVTAEAGLNGIDCPVRPGGEIAPEAAIDEMPRYSEALARRNLKIWLLTTAITSTASPHAEDILKAGRRLGIKYYRLGFIKRDLAGADAQMREIRSHLKDLAAMNRQLGLCALLQNHSPSGGTTYFGGDLADLEAAVEGFDPRDIGVAFDIGHALVVHGDQWRSHFERLRPHFKIAYVKDVQRGRGWVPFGTGELASTGYFPMLKTLGYHEPVSLHVEFDWTEQGRNKDRAALVKALQQSAGVLRQWLA